MFRYARRRRAASASSGSSTSRRSIDDPAIDAELIALQAAWLKALGIETTLLLNSIGDRACRPLTPSGSKPGSTSTPPSSTPTPATSARPVRCASSTPRTRAGRAARGRADHHDALCDGCREHFESVCRYLDACAVDYTLAPRLVRGLDYYTRTAFEFVAPGLGAQDTSRPAAATTI